MLSVHVLPALHVLNCDRVAVHTERTGRSKVKRLLLVKHSHHPVHTTGSVLWEMNWATYTSLFQIVPTLCGRVGEATGCWTWCTAHRRVFCDALEFDLTRRL